MSKRHPGVRTRTLVRKVDGMLLGVGDTDGGPGGDGDSRLASKSQESRVKSQDSGKEEGEYFLVNVGNETDQVPSVE